MRTVLLAFFMFFLGVCFALSIDFALTVFLTNGDNRISNVSPASYTPSRSLQIDSAHGNDEPDGISEGIDPTQFTVSSLVDVKRFKSPFDRSLALRILLSNSTKKQVLGLLEESKNTIPHTRDRDLQRAILQRLAQLCPADALSQIEALELTNSRTLVSSVFFEWSHFNLDEAVKHASSLASEDRRTALVSILQQRQDLSNEQRRHIARRLGNERYAIDLIAQERIVESLLESPEHAWYESVEKLQNDLRQSGILDDIAIEWVESSGLSVLDQVSESLTNLQTRQSVLASVLSNVAKTDPQGAFEYALQLSGDQHNSIIASVAREWARLDPQSALAAVSQLEEANLRQRLEESVVTAWARSKPRDVLADLDLVPEHVRGSATTQAISTVAQHNPKEASEFVVNLESGITKLQAAMSVIGLWSFRDQKSALEWILNNQEMEELRPVLMASILPSLANTDPKFAMETALSQPLLENSPGLEATVIHQLVQSDFNKALKFLPQVRAGPGQTEAYGSVGVGYIEKGEIDSAFNLAQELPEASRTAYFLALVEPWARTEPTTLLDSLNRLPTAELKSKAAQWLISYDRWQANLSNEQVETAKGFLTQEDAEKVPQ